MVLGPDDGLFTEDVRLSGFRLQDPRMGSGGQVTGFARASGRTTGRQPAPSRSGRTGARRACFEDAQRAVAPGQSLVLYDGEGLVLGGGIIEGAEGKASLG